MGRRYDNYDERDTSEEFIFAHEDGRSLRSGGEEVSGAQRMLTVGRTSGSSEPASVEAYGYQPWCVAQSAVASWGIYYADDGRADRPEDGRDGKVSCRGALVVRRGWDGGDDRSHEYRGFSEHSWAGGGRGAEQDHREICCEGRIYREQDMFVGYNGTGGSDSASRGRGRGKRVSQRGRWQCWVPI